MVTFFKKLVAVVRSTHYIFFFSLSLSFVFIINILTERVSLHTNRSDEAEARASKKKGERERIGRRRKPVVMSPIALIPDWSVVPTEFTSLSVSFSLSPLFFLDMSANYPFSGLSVRFFPVFFSLSSSYLLSTAYHI
jgi:hypothetical protein